MSEKTFCVRCALDVAASRRNPGDGTVELVDGVCPECGGTRGFEGDLADMLYEETPTS